MSVDETTDDALWSVPSHGLSRRAYASGPNMLQLVGSLLLGSAKMIKV